MDPVLELQQLKSERETLLAKADDNTLTEQDGQRADQVAKRMLELTNKIEKRDQATQRLKAAIASGGTAPASRTSIEAGDAGPGAAGNGPLGGWSGSFRKALTAADPVVGGTSKALVPSGNLGVVHADKIVVEDKPARFLSSAVTWKQVHTPLGAYLRQTTRTNAATTVPLGQRKPTSSYALEPGTWHTATIAHLTEPFPKQFLEDYGALVPFLEGELGYGLMSALDEFLLNGGTAEDGTEVDGLLADADIATVAFATDALTSIRNGLGELDAAGINTTAVAMAEPDWRALTLLKDNTGRFLLDGGPHDAGRQVLWGRPVVLVDGMPQGTAMAGDLASVEIKHREMWGVAWFDRGTYDIEVDDGSGGTTTEKRELAEHNEVRARAEGRVGLEVARPTALRKISLAAA